jgi:hypothetical protein
VHKPAAREGKIKRGFAALRAGQAVGFPIPEWNARPLGVGNANGLACISPIPRMKLGARRKRRIARMKRATWLPATTLALALAAGPALGQGAAPATVTAEPVSTATLASICAATSPNAESPLTAYCRGFMIGAAQYHNAVSAANGRPIFCLPTPSPTVEQVQSAFVAWARNNTQYGQERAVEGLMRFAASAYPCPPAPAPAPTRGRR